MATEMSIVATDNVGYNFSQLLDPNANFEGNSGGLKVTHQDGSFQFLFGSGFDLGYDQFGNPHFSGTVTSYYEGYTFDGQDTAVLSVAGAGISLDSIMQAAATGSTDDDHAVLANIFASNDTILGSEYSDILAGYAGNDFIFDGDGSDAVYGGDGDDTFVMADDFWADGVDGGYGYDLISYEQFSVGVSVDLQRGTAFDGYNTDYLFDVEALTGSGYNDQLWGNAYGNIIAGLNGDDYINGGGGADTLNGGAGNDTYYVDNTRDVIVEAATGGTSDWVVTSVGYALSSSAYVEKLSTTSSAGTTAINLTGNGIAQTITGNAGVNVLNGGAGNDTLNGGAGNDTYYVDNTRDVIVEASTGGTSDWVVTSVSYALSSSAYVEKLSTTSSVGTTAINLTGNGIAQTITGNAGVNVLNGAAGNDTLNGAGGNDVIYGGAGKDTLTGGAGYDYFVFSTALNATTNVDRITDFNVVQDTIRLENAVMPGLGSHLGTLYAANFWKSTTGLAHDANDRIIYETDTGWLNYDSNGSAAGGAVHIALLAPNLALTHADFFVI